MAREGEKLVHWRGLGSRREEGKRTGWIGVRGRVRGCEEVSKWGG